jgi:hypothetical protein
MLSAINWLMHAAACADAYRAAIGRVMSQGWDALLPCHGTYIERDGKRVLKQFLQQ